MSDAIVDLAARGDIGTASDTAYASLGYEAALGIDAEICSGLRLGLAASLRGRGAAGVEIADFLEASVEVEAGAAVKAEIVAQASPDVSDTFGLTLAASLQARAYIRARLAAEMRLGDLFADALADGGTADLEQRLTAALVRHVTLEVGVEASVELAVAASAIVAARMNLLPPDGQDPGFDIQIGAGAGFLFGTDIGVFVRGRLPSAGGFLAEATDIVMAEIIAEAALDDAAAPLVTWAVRTATRCVTAALDGDRVAAADGTETALRHLLGEIVEAAVGAAVERVAASAIVAAIGAIDPPPVDLVDRARWIMRADAASRPQAVLALLADLAEAVGHDPTAPEPPVARLSAAAHALLFLLDPAHPALDAALPDHVRRIAELPPGSTHFTTAAQAAAVIDGGWLDAAVRDLPAPLGVVATAALDAMAVEGIGLRRLLLDPQTLDNDAVARVARAAATALYEHGAAAPLEAMIASATVRGTLPPAMTDLLRALVHGTGKVVLPILADIAAENDAKKIYALQAELREASARLAVSFLAGHVARIGARAVVTVTARTGERIEQMRQDLAEDDALAARLADGMLAILERALPDVDLHHSRRRDRMVAITRDMMKDLLDAAMIAFGPGTWTPGRIDRIADGMLELTTGIEGGRIDWASDTAADLRRTFRHLSDCPGLPDGFSDHLTEVGTDLSEIAIAQAGVFLDSVPRILSDHVPALARETILVVVEECLDEIAARIADAIATLDALIAEVQETLDKLTDVIADAAHASLKKAEAAIAAAIETLRAATLDWLDGEFARLIANIDVDASGFFTRLADMALTFLGAPDVITSGDETVERARKDLRAIRDRVRARLTPAAFDDLRLAAVGSRHRARPDLRALHGALMDGLLTRDERDSIAAVPVVAGTQAGLDPANGTFGTAFETLAGALDISESVHLRIASQSARKVALSSERDGLVVIGTRARAAMRAAPLVRFNAPLPVQVGAAHPVPILPIYGRFVQLEIDFGTLDLGHLDAPPDLSFAALARDDLGRPTPGNVAIDRLLDRGDVALRDLSLIDVRLFLNGTEVALDTLQRDGSRLSGTIPEHLLTAGTNHALLTITPAPALGLGAPVVRHVAFQRDASRMDRPSNAVCIDPEATVIDTVGDDHDDARGRGKTDRERVVIRNRTADKTLSLKDWVLEDAHGHRLVLDGVKLPPGARAEIVIGRVAGGVPRTIPWVVDHGHGIIAVLNNRGERLLLRDPGGRIVSQLFTGTPAANPDIVFLRERAER